jgi:predicted transcriptional regulator
MKGALRERILEFLSSTEVRKRAKRRSELQITYAIVSHLPARRTELLYSSRMNYIQLRRYLKQLVSERLVFVDGEVCKATSLGIAFVRAYDRYLVALDQLSNTVDALKDVFAVNEPIRSDWSPMKRPGDGAKTG